MSLYVRIRGRVHGPLDLEKLKALARKGQLSRIHEISSDQQAWQPAGSMPELFQFDAPSVPTSVPTPGRPGGDPIRGTMQESPSGQGGHGGQSPGAFGQGSIHATAVEAGVNGLQPLSMDDGSGYGENAFLAGNATAGGSVVEWYYAIDGQQSGPVGTGQLRALIQQGTLGPHDMLWRDGMNEWLEVEGVGELQSQARLFPASGGVGPSESSTLALELLGSRPWVRFVMIGAFVVSVFWLLFSLGVVAMSVASSQVFLLTVGMLQLLYCGVLFYFGITLVGLMGHLRIVQSNPSSRSIVEAARQMRTAWMVLAIFVMMVLTAVLLGTILVGTLLAIGADLATLNLTTNRP